jgi:tight adherence protein C
MQMRNPATPISVALAVDSSGSMADDHKLTQAQAAAKQFAQQMRPRDRIALLSFADDVNVPQPLTPDRALLARAIDKLAAGGNTRLYDGVAQGVTQLSLAPEGARALVVLTDGLDTASQRTLQDDVAQAVRTAVPVYAIGLGSDADTEVLQQLAASSGGRYYRAPTGQDLMQVFRLISGQLTSQFEVSWLSRSRVSAGQDVSVQMSIDRAGGSPELVSFTYAPPTFGRAARAEPNNPVQALVELAPTAAPSQEQAVAAGPVAGAAVLLLFIGWLRTRANRRLQARLTTYVAGRPALASMDTGTPIRSPRLRVNPLMGAAARLMARLLPGKQIERLRRKLIQAGHPSDRHLSMFLAAELALAVVLATVTYELLQLRGFAQRSPIVILTIAGLVGLFGMYLPYMWLRRRVEWRQRMLLRALPDGLDLMAIAVSAGLSLDSAMAEVVQKWDGELSREFGQVLNEMRLGASRRQALRDLAERTQLQDLQLLVAALLQADELGANVSETLAVQAAQLRVRRRQVAEEKARKAPVKMLVPLVLFIFPAIFVVVLAPAILQFLNVFRSFAHHA